MTTPLSPTEQPTLSRRQLLQACLVGGGLAVSGLSLLHWLRGPRLTAQTFIGHAGTYDADFAILIRQGLQELGVTQSEIKGKRILLKPNLVEPHKSSSHINTHPLVVQGAVEAFLHFGASFSGSCRRAWASSRYPLSFGRIRPGGCAVRRSYSLSRSEHDGGRNNTQLGGHTKLTTLTFPRVVKEIDWVVSWPR